MKSLNLLDRQLCDMFRTEPPHCDALSIEQAIAMAAKTTDLALNPEPCCEEPVGEMLSDFLTLQVRAREVLLQERCTMVSAMTQSIRRLRDVGSASSLDTQLCAELRGSLGFVHVALSVVEADRFRVEYVDGAAPSAAVVASAANSPTETRCIRDRIALMASGSSATLCYAELLESASYIVAVATVDNKTVLVHAARGDVTKSADVELIGTAATAYAVIRERLLRFERLRAQQRRLTWAAARLAAKAENIAASTLDLGADDATGWALMSDDKVLPASSALSPRERDVCELISVGASNAEIAESLVLSIETVRTNVKRVLRKLGVANRSEAIAHFAGKVPAAVTGQSQCAG